MHEKGKDNNASHLPVNTSINACSNASSRAHSFFIFSEKLSFSKYLRWLILALLPVLILLRYPVDDGNIDLWWQMAHGKYYLAHHTFRMDMSIFSWTPTDPTWIYNTCLGSIVTYLFYNALGGFGLWIMQWLIFLGVFLSFCFFLRLINQRLDINGVTVIAVIGFACSPSCRFYKPELFSLLLFSWSVLIFFYFKITRKKFLLYIYPVIFAFWVNLHGAFLVGIVFLVLTLIGEILNKIFFPRESLDTEELVYLGTAIAISLAATLVNPYGINYLWSLYPSIINTITFQNYSGLHEEFIMAYQSLWQFLTHFSVKFFSASFTAWIMTIMILFILLLLIYDLIKKKSCDVALLIVSLALYWKGMETSRASYFFPVSFFFIFFYLLIHRLKLKNIYDKVTIFSLFVFIFFFISISYMNIRYNVDYKWFGAELENSEPIKEVAFLKKYRPEGMIFNDYAIGSYLLWALYPDYKVFIDPRGGLLYKNQVLGDYIKFTSKPLTSEDINCFTQKYPFKIAIISHQPLVLSFLKESDEWRLLYFEKHAAILIHTSLFFEVISKMSNEIKDPHMLLKIMNSPARFQDIRNPKILINVFNYYVRISPEKGRYIYDLFKKNVSDYFKLKQEYLGIMEFEIRQREQELHKQADKNFSRSAGDINNVLQDGYSSD
ncbi:MAG: hypothetical protein JW925_05205 [Syntrophaceae bacterium]|nr:hypothetical protein [Syntrophaceae bacterium]